MTASMVERHNVTVWGATDSQVLMFAHGFGSDQKMWDRILPSLSEQYRLVLFDHMGSGGSDPAFYDSSRYSSLDAYVSDLLEICAELDLTDVTLIGHSVGAMMAISAAAADQHSRIARLVLVTASPSYMNHPADGYFGGYSSDELDELFESLDANYLVWAEAMAPVFMNVPSSPHLEQELQGSFRRINPTVARDFARVAFCSDVRHLLSSVELPVLILQSTNDVLTPEHIGTYLQERMPRSVLVTLTATGHFPQTSAPEETVSAILDYLGAAA
ncbi:alpha/beta hydrolase [Arthrobacter alkaliphilus]|uniref:alpha/beta fold hydrolase n=1 Tax=Arthrobacter alkaliphilus TaxID=369936 RepID=UPI001F1E66FD|nr:alpha/beta hydrolase [Arthrobacter alkaliphilus]